MPLLPPTLIEPSPFPPKVYPDQTVFLYMDGIDLTVFADRPSLELAAQQFAQGAAETFTVRLQHYANPHIVGVLPAPLPEIREGRVQVFLIKRFGTDPADYEELASGTVSKRSYLDTSMAGASVFVVDTPLKTLKVQFPFLRFTPDQEPTDVDRLRRLGRDWHHQDFDFSLPDQEPYVSYPLPYYGADSQNYVSGRSSTDYKDRSVDDIIRDINTYVGQALNLDYPVPTRHWWWSARFRDDGNPALGIQWHLHIQRADQGPTGPDLVDVPDASDPTALVYDQGATLEIDYAPVVRRVRVTGGVWQEELISGGWVASGDTPSENIQPASDGFVRKVDGGVKDWDTNAIYCGTWSPGTSQIPVYLHSDFRLAFQIQETYIAHDTFKGADEVPLARNALVDGDARFFPPGSWESFYVDLTEASHNVMGRMANGARAMRTNIGAISLVNARATNVIVRGRMQRVGMGMALILRANVDPDTHVLNSAIVLYADSPAEAPVWTIGEWSGGVLTPTVYGGMTLQGAPTYDTLKVHMKNNRIEVYKNDDYQSEYTLEPYGFNDEELWHGIGVLSGPDATIPVWDDFNITTYFGDKAAGVGDALGGVDYFWIGYGVVWNTNGTTTLMQGGTPVDSLGLGDYGQAGIPYDFGTLEAYAATHGGDMPLDVEYLWEDILLAHNALNEGYNTRYNDVWKMGCVRYIDEGSRSLKRKVQWWLQKGGVGEDILMRELLGLDHDVIYYNSAEDFRAWYGQVALRDLGMTFTNTVEGGQNTDLFYPTGDLADELTPLVGDFPSIGSVQSDLFVTYELRQRIGLSILRHLADPNIRMRCDVHPQPDPGHGQVLAPYQRGALVRVSNRRAGWVADHPLGDRRRYLTVMSQQRVTAGVRGKRPTYRLTLGDINYDLTDPTRTSILISDAEGGMPESLPVPEGRRGTQFSWGAAVTQDKWHGDYLDVRVHPLNNAQVGELPVLTFPAGVREIQLPVGMLPPDTTYEVQHRTRTKNGRVSPWSVRYTGTTPPTPAYDRPFMASFPIGDGATVIPVTALDTDMHELQLNEACAVAGWGIVQNGLGGVTVDVQYATEADRLATGLLAYASLCGLLGAKPYTSATRFSGSANSGQDLRGWEEKHLHLERGDWLRVVVTAVAPGTVATMGTVSIHLRRLRAETEVEA